MKVGFIGAGKVGTSLGKYMTEHQVLLSGYYSRTLEHARWAAAFTGAGCYSNIFDLVADSDILFLTVGDDAILKVVQDLQQEEIRGKYICHCSGAATSEVLYPLQKKGAYAASLHPLCAVSSREQGWRDLETAYFTIEGDQAGQELLQTLFLDFGTAIEVISPEVKAKYHMAAVFASNFVTALYEEAAELLEGCGLSREFSCSALAPLFLQNAQNIIQKGTRQALTGPVERADIGTVEKHLNEAEGAQRLLYQLLSQKLADLAEEKNPNRDYTELRRLLEPEKAE